MQNFIICTTLADSMHMGTCGTRVPHASTVHPDRDTPTHAKILLFFKSVIVDYFLQGCVCTLIGNVSHVCSIILVSFPSFSLSLSRIHYLAPTHPFETRISVQLLPIVHEQKEGALVPLYMRQCSRLLSCDSMNCTTSNPIAYIHVIRILAEQIESVPSRAGRTH